MCFICSQPKGFETDIATIIKDNKNPILEVNQTNLFKLQPPEIGSNQNKYTFEISGIDKSHTLYEGIQKNSIAAIEYVTTKIKWKGTIDFVAKVGGKEEWFQQGNGFGTYGNPNHVLHEATTGNDLYLQRPNGWDEWAQVDWDAGSHIKLNQSNTGIRNYGFPVFIDPNPIYEDSSAIPHGHHDFYSIFMHEFCHILGIIDEGKFAKLSYSENNKVYFGGEATNLVLGHDLRLTADGYHYFDANNEYPLMGGDSLSRTIIKPMDQAVFGDLGYGIVRDCTESNDNLLGGLGDDIINLKGGRDIIKARSGDDIIDGGNGYDIATYNGNFKDYTCTLSNKIVTVTDNRTSVNDGTDTLSNIEKLSFADKSALITSKGIQEVNSLGFQSTKIYSGKSDTYKFYNLGSDKYGVETNTGIDELTGASLLRFDDKDMNLIKDIKGTFDQVTGLNTDSGRMFRLYNASFKRLPDPDGLKYWIEQFSSGANSIRVVASSFLGSSEFAERYGSNVTDEKFVTTLYQNVLGRSPDSIGLNYWLGQLSSGAETRYEALLGFAESAENKSLFTDMTGFG